MVGRMDRPTRTTTTHYGWPPILGRARAADYCGVDPATIDRARRAGQIAPAGRRGGHGEWTYTRVALDRWMAGAPEPSPGPRRVRRGSSGGGWCDDLDDIAGGVR